MLWCLGTEGARDPRPLTRAIDSMRPEEVWIDAEPVGSFGEWVEGEVATEPLVDPTGEGIRA